jgi:dTDP-glucose 4,6-dehydratase
VIHLAAIAGVTSYYEMPKKTMEVNIIGTYNLLEAIEDKNVERYIHFSTSEVYGSYSFRSREDSNTSQGNISDPRWTYAISKLSAEKLGYCYHFEKQLPMVSIRPFNIYGPWQIGEGAIQSFITKAIHNVDIPITGDGSQIRAWCYIEDIISAVISCIEIEHAVGHSFNIGNPEGTITILGLAKKIIEMTNSKSKIFFKDHIGTDIELRVPNITKAREILGYSPQVDIDEGLLLTINSYKQNPW